ncbi:Leucine-rich repeat domain superfamily [Sesbania bispinosa]|nr:Leucine-rich repeat domain superfamily [Sesbania bispinosa]
MRFGSTATTSSSTRRERLPKMQKANEDDDIISKLPESLISRILSFLPTKDAVRTSVLSKIWIQRWTSITKLDFDDTVFYSPKRKTGGKQFFMNFVNRALLLTKGSSMESFSLVMANKKFETVNCIWSSAKDVTLEAPLLESVLIEEDSNSVSHGPRSCTIYFSALHLKEFTYRGFCISQPITLSDPSSAHNASAKIILYQCENRVPATGSRAFLLLTQFSQVKCIKFDGSEVLAQQKVSALPVFGMLSHLELGLVTGEVLLGILLKSPILKTLLFKGISKFDIELLNSAVVPDCLASTLQVVKFGKVHGYEHELYLAKFMMENGLVLERMSFSLASHGLGRSKVMEEFKEKLFSFKKGFSFAIVEFSYD